MYKQGRVRVLLHPEGGTVYLLNEDKHDHKCCLPTTPALGLDDARTNIFRLFQKDLLWIYFEPDVYMTKSYDTLR